MSNKKYNFRKYKIRTVPKKKRGLFGTVLLLRIKATQILGTIFFIILLPYLFATFMGGVQFNEKKSYSTPIMVVRQTDMGMERIPLEEYLPGALAASIDPSYEPEALKAQAVILRTMVHKQYQNRENKSSDEVNVDMLQQEYMTLRQMKERFGENFEAYYEKLQTAVGETEGRIIQYENIAVDTPYFFVSNGKTRDGREVFDSADYPQLQSVDSSMDMGCPDYLCRYSYDRNQFIRKVEELLCELAKEDADAESADAEDMEPEASYQPVRVSDMKIQRDSCGYVLVIEAGGREISGELFRDFFQWNSACFTIKEQSGVVEIETKGIGHGVGMSQYGANEMAKSGETFIKILQHYFTNTEIQRN